MALPSIAPDSIARRLKRFLLPNFLTTFRPPSRSESLRILNSTGSDFMDRYRALMRINHPDMGGSAYICMKVNQAKDYLLEDRRTLY